MKKIPLIHQTLQNKQKKRKHILIFITTLCLLGNSSSLYAMPKEAPASSAPSASSLDMKAAFSALDAETLCNLRTPYVGDASAVGKLLYEMEGLLPSGSYEIELDTEEPPYVLRLAYKEEPAEGEDETSYKMNIVGTLLLALIDNLEEVQWSYPTQIDGEEVLFTGYWNLDNVSGNYSLGSDEIKGSEEIKDSEASKENLQSLLERLSQSISTIGGSDGPKSISIIGGADGPTSIYISEGKNNKS